MTDGRELPLVTRLWFAWACFFRVLASGGFARSVWELAYERVTAADAPVLPAAPAPAKPPSSDAAMQLLALLQREGRLVDFVQQDITAFSDSDVGVAARVVHEGCKKALGGCATLAPLRAEEEGTRVTVAAGFDPDELKLTGNGQGNPPYTGTLRHRGWRLTDLHLPTSVRAHDATVVAPAEIEL
jgi:Domain of unknown function (DUF2760)